MQGIKFESHLVLRVGRGNKASDTVDGMNEIKFMGQPHGGGTDKFQSKSYPMFLQQWRYPLQAPAQKGEMFMKGELVG